MGWIMVILDIKLQAREYELGKEKQSSQLRTTFSIVIRKKALSGFRHHRGPLKDLLAFRLTTEPKGCADISLIGLKSGKFKIKIKTVPK